MVGADLHVADATGLVIVGQVRPAVVARGGRCRTETDVEVSVTAAPGHCK